MNKEDQQIELLHERKNFMTLKETIVGVIVVSTNPRLYLRLTKEGLIRQNVTIIGVEVKNHEGILTTPENLDENTVVLAISSKDNRILKLKLDILHKEGFSLIEIIKGSFYQEAQAAA